MPARPSGMRSVSAASGPYAAELSASRPKTGMPAIGPMCSARSSEVASGLPIRKLSSNMLRPLKAVLGAVKAGKDRHRSRFGEYIETDVKSLLSRAFADRARVLAGVGGEKRRRGGAV